MIKLDARRSTAGVRAPDERCFACVACGHRHPLWKGRCTACGEQKGMVTVAATPAAAAAAALPRVPSLRAVPDAVPGEPVDESEDEDDEPVPISTVAEESFARDLTGLDPLDHVLGGGVVAGSVVLLAAPPGVGKTTLSLQFLRGLGCRSLYATAEETRSQVSMTAHRIGTVSEDLLILAQHDLGKILDKAEKHLVRALVVDSIQEVSCADLDGRAGSPGQLKECTARLVRFAKRTGTVVWIIGHVTSDGDIAGPKTIEHKVDVVIELTRGPAMEGRERVVRVVGKNRFGPGHREGRFELGETGLVAIDGDGWAEEQF